MHTLRTDLGHFAQVQASLFSGEIMVLINNRSLGGGSGVGEAGVVGLSLVRLVV